MSSMVLMLVGKAVFSSSLAIDLPLHRDLSVDRIDRALQDAPGTAVCEISDGGKLTKRENSCKSQEVVPPPLPAATTSKRPRRVRGVSQINMR